MREENNSAAAKIKSMEIRNFRGIKFFKLDRLGKINIFVGRNSAGKTTLLDALFLNTGGRVENIEQIESFRNYDDKSFQYAFNLFHNLEPENIPKLKFIYKDDNEVLLSIHPISGANKNENNTSAPKITGYEVKLKINGTEITNKQEIVNTQKYFAGYDSYKHLSITSIRELIVAGDKQYLIASLKRIIPNLKNVEEINNDFFVTIDGIKRLLPLKMQGDGMIRIAKVISGMYVMKNNFYLIDEIENGLHYRSQQLLWKVVCEQSLKGDIDLFITSHSYEMMQQLCKFLEKEENTKYRDLVFVHTLVKKKEKIDVISYNFQEFAEEIENSSEIRGLF